MVSAVVASSSKKRLFILPSRALIYFSASVLIILLALACLDRLLLPLMERRGEIASSSWREHNARVNEEMGQRNWANQDNPIWRSGLFKVAEGAHQKKRILVMGDSYAWGDGQANMNDIWWRQLQFELEHRGYNNVEVIAAGRCGYSTNAEMRWLKKLNDMYKPDAILFGYVTNDPDEGSETPGDGFVKQLRQPPQDSEFNNAMSWFNQCFPHLGYQLKELRTKKRSEEVSGANGYIYSTWELKLLEGKNFQAYSQTVHQLGDFVRSSGVPTFVMTLPMPFEQYRKNYAPVEKLFAEAGVPFSNVFDAMLKWYKESQPKGSISALAVNPVNGHPGLSANRFYANQAADLLEKNYPQVLGDKGGTASAKDGIEINDYLPPIMALSRPKPKIFAIHYPVDDNLFLLMPLDRPYVQLNLARQYSFKEIHIIGKDLSAASLAVRASDKPGVEPTVRDLGKKTGTGCIFKIPKPTWGIDELLITAELGKDKQVLVEFVE